MQHVLDHAHLWIGDETTLDGHIVIDGGTIAAVEPGRYAGRLPCSDLGGCALSPGLIDLMVLGGFGRSILRDDPLDIARAYLPLGVTSCLFCTGLLPFDKLPAVAAKIRAAIRSDRHDHARVLGLYCEGPFMQRPGAGRRDNILPPSAPNIERLLQAAGDVVRLVNISPGTETDRDAISRLRAAGIALSMAHSDAPAQRILECLDAGTTILGHIWNNNSGLIGDSGVQQPTIEHVALTDERIRSIHLICDGVHVHPILVKLLLRCRGLEAICLVTDANQRSGCPDGPFIRDDGQEFYKEGGVCRRKADGGLAGSATFLPDDFRNFCRFTSSPPHRAIRTVTLNPARSLGLDGQTGLIVPGRAADLIAWDEQLRITRIWRNGVEANATTT